MSGVRGIFRAKILLTAGLHRHTRKIEKGERHDVNDAHGPPHMQVHKSDTIQTSNVIEDYECLPSGIPTLQ